LNFDEFVESDVEEEGYNSVSTTIPDFPNYSSAFNAILNLSN
jgi:hypothetical protein